MPCADPDGQDAGDESVARAAGGADGRAAAATGRARRPAGSAGRPRLTAAGDAAAPQRLKKHLNPIKTTKVVALILLFCV